MQTAQIRLSLLDLVRVKQGSDAAGALAEAQEIAAHVDDLGYNRYWVAEHHNMQRALLHNSRLTHNFPFPR